MVGPRSDARRPAPIFRPSRKSASAERLCRRAPLLKALDAYSSAYRRYAFCAVCEFEDGWVTLLSQTLWKSEVIRRVRPAAQSFHVHIARLN